MNQSNSNITMSKIIEIIQLMIGVATVIFFGIGGIGFLFDDVDDTTFDYTLVCIFLIIGFLLIKASRKRYKLSIDYRKYTSWLKQNPGGSIAELASNIGITDEIVINNINKMIDKKFFLNAYIDMEKKQIVFPDEYITMKCQSCGGINKTQKNAVGKCEYCGSYIK